jgi:hypothetical protein
MEMTAIELAERKSRWRAFGFLVLGALSVALMAFNLGPGTSDFTRGMWLGVLAGSAVNLLPVKRWLRPNSAVAQLLEDESVRENRRLSCNLGFWGSTVTAIVIAAALGSGVTLKPLEVAEIIATAGIASAMVAFALLELRAAR